MHVLLTGCYAAAVLSAAAFGRSEHLALALLVVGVLLVQRVARRAAGRGLAAPGPATAPGHAAAAPLSDVRTRSGPRTRRVAA